jgi:hypothetical protein
VRAVLAKGDGEKRKSADDMEHAIRQIISRAIASDEVVDIFAAAGLKKPDISILSDEFLADVRNLPHKNLAVETLRKLLNNEIKIRARKFLIQSRSFADMLEESIHKYQNRAIETAAVIEELIALAKEIRESENRGDKLGLTENEVAFYDALEVNDSAVKVLGDDCLRFIARELLKTIRENVTIDWTANASCENTVIRPTNKKRQRKRSCNRQNCCVRTGHLEPDFHGSRWPAQAIDSAQVAASIHRTRRDGFGLFGGPCGFPMRSASQLCVCSARASVQPHRPPFNNLEGKIILPGCSVGQVAV